MHLSTMNTTMYGAQGLIGYAISMQVRILHADFTLIAVLLPLCPFTSSTVRIDRVSSILCRLILQYCALAVVHGYYLVILKVMCGQPET